MTAFHDPENRSVALNEQHRQEYRAHLLSRVVGKPCLQATAIFDLPD